MPNRFLFTAKWALLVNLIALSLISTTSFAGLFEADHIHERTVEMIKDFKKTGRRISFLDPNEKHPVDALPVLAGIKSGAYISVGSERCFMMGAMLENITSLICADNDPKIVVYNLINMTLLRFAKNREHYISLRLVDSLNSWRTQVAGSSRLTPSEQALLSDEVIFDFWNKNVRENIMFSYFHTKYDPSLPRTPFAGAHYLYDDKAFHRISWLARSFSISAQLIDFRDETDALRLMTHLSRRRIQISAIDLSNAWWDNYAGATLLIDLANRLLDRNELDARLIFTGWLGPTGPHTGWGYYSVEIKTLLDRQNNSDFFHYVLSLQTRAIHRKVDIEEFTQPNGYMYRTHCRNLLR